MSKIRGLRQLPNGTWRARHLGKDWRFTTRDEALAQLERWQNPEVPRVASDATLYAYMARWVGGRGDLAPSSQRKYDRDIEAYLRHYPIGRRRLDRITPADLEAYYRALEGHIGSVSRRPLSPNTINGLRRLLSTALRDAAKRGLIASNPVPLTRGPKATKPRIDPPSAEQVARILAAIEAAPRAGDARLSALYRILAGTGLRIGEALGLTWGHVELEGDLPLIRIRRKLDDERGLSAPKTPNSIRDLPIGAELVEALRDHQARQAIEAQGPRWVGELGLVFPSNIGTPLDPRNANKTLERALASSGVAAERRAAGFDPMTHHDFRHFFATSKVAAGVGVGLLSRYLGHASVSTTLDLYYHPTTADLSAILAGSSSASYPHNQGANGRHSEPQVGQWPTSEMGQGARQSGPVVLDFGPRP